MIYKYVLLSLVLLLNILYLFIKSGNSSIFYNRAPPPKQAIPKLPPKPVVPKHAPKQVIPKYIPTKQAAPSTSGCTRLGDENSRSKDICCTAPRCQRFSCKDGTMPNETDMQCNENYKLQCAIQDGITYCMCNPITPIDGKCPDGYEIEQALSGSCGGRLPPVCVCSGAARRENYCRKSNQGPKKLI